MALAKGMATSNQGHLGSCGTWLTSRITHCVPAAVWESFMPILPKASRTSWAEAFHLAETTEATSPVQDHRTKAVACGSGFGAQVPSGCFATGPRAELAAHARTACTATSAARRSLSQKSVAQLMLRTQPRGTALRAFWIQVDEANLQPSRAANRFPAERKLWLLLALLQDAFAMQVSIMIVDMRAAQKGTKIVEC